MVVGFSNAPSQPRNKGVAMSLRRKSLRIAVASILGSMLFAALTPENVQARSPYDGSWSVLVVTESGDCDRAYRYAVLIKDGVLSHGESAVPLTGRVNAGGRVQVKIGSGERSASGTGRLSRNTGTGVWRASSKRQGCGGRWEAERR